MTSGFVGQKFWPNPSGPTCVWRGSTLVCLITKCVCLSIRVAFGESDSNYGKSDFD